MLTELLLLMLEPDPSQRATAHKVLRAVRQEQRPGDCDAPSFFEWAYMYVRVGGRNGAGGAS